MHAPPPKFRPGHPVGGGGAPGGAAETHPCTHLLVYSRAQVGPELCEDGVDEQGLHPHKGGGQAQGAGCRPALMTSQLPLPMRGQLCCCNCQANPGRRQNAPATLGSKPASQPGWAEQSAACKWPPGNSLASASGRAHGPMHQCLRALPAPSASPGHSRAGSARGWYPTAGASLRMTRARRRSAAWARCHRRLRERPRSSDSPAVLCWHTS